MAEHIVGHVELVSDGSTVKIAVTDINGVPYYHGRANVELLKFTLEENNKSSITTITLWQNDDISMRINAGSDSI